jgi:hypothetical protein
MIVSVTRFALVSACLGFAFVACSSPSNPGNESSGATGGSNAGMGTAGNGGSAPGTGGSMGQAGKGGSGGSVTSSGGTGGASTGGASTGGTSTGGTSSGGTGASAGMSGTGGAQSGGSAGVGGGVSGAGGSGAAAGSATGGTSAGGMGAGGGAGMGAGGMTGGSGCDIPGKILCEDFESEALGSLPTAAPWAPVTCSDTTHVLKVDGGAYHSGAQSLLGENIPYADCQLHADLGASLSEYWVRAWVYYGTAAPTSSTHEVTVFELVPAASTDDPSIRVGYRGDTCMPVGVELNITGGGQEETGCTGAIPMANTWYCYVLHVQQAASSVTTDLSIDGVAQSYTNHGTPESVITSQVAGVRYLRLGARSYSGNWANPIYVDDVAVATQVLGCQ